VRLASCKRILSLQFKISTSLQPVQQGLKEYKFLALCYSWMQRLVGLIRHKCKPLGHFAILWRACNLTAFTHSSTGPVVHPFASCHKGPGFNPQGVLMWDRDSPVSIVSLHWWPGRDWSLWPRLRRASSWTITRMSCRPCDNPTWSHTAFLSRFHAHCRSFFRLHNRHGQLLGGSPVQSLQSHCSHKQFHRSSGPPICIPSWGT
jgi:hypothetical protein